MRGVSYYHGGCSGIAQRRSGLVASVTGPGYHADVLGRETVLLPVPYREHKPREFFRGARVAA